MRTWVSIMLAGCIGTVSAQIVSVTAAPLTVHPASPRHDGPLLIQIQDQWPNACGGRIDVQASASRIELVARQQQPQGQACAQVLTPFRRLIDAAALLPPGTAFAPQVTIQYSHDDGQIRQLRLEREIVLSSAARAPAQARAQAGGWTTPALENSGLFVDQQGDVLTLALFDYDQDGKASWHYGVGQLDGDVLKTPMHSYAESFCVTLPCPRATPVHSGEILAVVSHNELLVNFHGVLRSNRTSEDQSYPYQRLDFERSAVLLQHPHAAQAPDLIGRWVVGVGWSEDLAHSFREVDIRHLDSAHGTAQSLPVHRFGAFPTGSSSTAALYTISCADMPGNASHCVVENYPHGNTTCHVRFAYAAVGHEQTQGSAACRFNAFRNVQLDFRMFKLD